MRSIINTSDIHSKSENIIRLGWQIYSNPRTIKNMGASPIENTKLVLFQNSNSYQKLNFDQLFVVFQGETKNTLVSQWRVDFEIKNAVSQENRTTSYSGNASSPTSVPVPNLVDNEYINSVTLIPLGIDGQSEGQLPSKNSISIGYSAKNWENLHWPNGTKIENNKVFEVSMAGKFYYDDATDNQNVVSEIKDMNIFTHYYAPMSAIDSEVFLVSGQSTNVKPSDVLDFELQGYLTDESFSDVWKSPSLSLAIPKEFEILNVDQSHAFKDMKNNTEVNDGGTIERLSTDSKYTYYKMTTKDSVTAYKNGVNTSFVIPLQIKVAPGTKVGTYKSLGVVSTGNDFLQVHREMNTLSDAEKYGLRNDVDKYTVSDAKQNSPITVAAFSKVDTYTQARPSAQDDWSEIEYYGVRKQSKPQMNAVIDNSGNSIFTNVKFYNILPKNGDARGSTGDVKFAGVNNNQGTVYYTDHAINTLPSYATANLQSWNTQTLNDHGFRNDPTMDLSTVTAVYIDFGNYEIDSGGVLSTELSFEIPNADDQKAVNQFIFSALEKGTPTVMNLSSMEVTFSTEIGQITYHENKPTLADGSETAGTVLGMPNPNVETVVLDNVRKGELEVTMKTPTLTGYQFTKWLDALAAKEYSGGQTVKFDQSVELDTLRNFDAQWTPNQYKVKFDKNTTDPVTGAMATQDFVYDVKQELTENDFERVGYTFGGWSTTATGSAIYDDKEEVMSLVSVNNGDITLYAVWTPNTYTVQFNANGGTPNTPYTKDYTYGVTSAFPAVEFERTGYKFEGWSTAQGDNNTVTHPYDKPVLNLIPSGTLPLYAVWSEIDYEIEVDLDGGKLATGVTIPETYTINTATITLPTATQITKDGYTFGGWSDGTNTVTTIAGGATGKVALTAKWDIINYDITTQLDGGTIKAGSEIPATYTVKTDTITLPTATEITKKGHSFEGWTDADGDAITQIAKGSIGDVELNANWKKIKYTLSFDLDGKGTAPASRQVEYDAEVGALPEPTAVGFSFKGWSTGANGGGKPYIATTKMPADHVKLFANWSTNDKRIDTTATNVNIKLADAAAFTGAGLFTATYIEVDEDGEKTVNEPVPAANITIDATELAAINAATVEGAYELTFTATYKGETESKTADVIITKDLIDPLPTEKTIIMLADNFNIKLADVKNADLVEKANARAFEIDENLALTRPDVTVTLDTAKPTTAGKHVLTYKAETAEKTVNALVYNEDPVANEVVTANGFTIKLEDVAGADFVGLAGAQGYDMTDPANPVEITAELKSEKPTTVGSHTARFETANGGFAEVKVLVTNEDIDLPEDGEFKEVVTARNFNVKLADVAGADFVGLAGAKGYKINDKGQIVEEGLTVTLSSSKPTTAGKFDAKFKTAGSAETRVDVYVSNEAVENNEIVTATGFTIKLADVTGADFVDLAGAKGYDVTSQENIFEIPVELKSEKPTTVGAHTARFETANGAFAEVTVLVTNEDTELPEDGEFKEVVTARNFSVKLADVAGADFVDLAGAKGYKINDKGQVVEEDLPVTLSSNKPTTAGKFDAKFKTAASAETRVDVYVSNEAVENNEIVTATGFTIKLADVTGADFVDLAGAKGYDVTSQENIFEIPVELKSAKPTTVGAHTARFETAGGAFAEVKVLVTKEDIDLPDVGETKEVVTARNFNVKLADVAGADFVGLANAKGYKINDKGQIVREDLPVTLTSNKPTAAGKTSATFKTATSSPITVDVVVSNETPVADEVVTAHGFTIALSEVAGADFVDLAGAKGYNVANPENITELPVELKSAKPTTVGKHTARFETAGGGFAEVTVLVTNNDEELPDVGETKEIVVAHGFTIALEDVQAADFVGLAEAKGYEINDKGEIVAEDLPVTLTSNKPIIIGKAQATFATADSAPVTVDVLVTKETPVLPPEGETAEVIIANDFEVELNDAQTANFAVLAGGEGYVINHRGEIVGTVAVTSTTEKPTTVGAFPVVLQTALGKTETVTMNVYLKGDLVLNAKDVELTLTDFKSIKTSDLEAEILKRSDAKVVNTATGAESREGFSVDVAPLEGIKAVGTYKTKIKYELDVDTQPRTRAAGQTTERVLEKDVTITVTNDPKKPTDPKLPTTGEAISETIVVSMFAIILSMGLVLFGNRRKNHNEK